MSYQYRELTDVKGQLCNIDAGRDHFNLGGLAELVIVPQVFVLGLPTAAPGSGSLTGTVQLLPGARMYQIGFTTETGGFTEKMPEDDAGVYFDQSLTVQIPKDRPEITTFKKIVKRGRYLLIYRDANGLAKVLPNMRLKLDLDTGTGANNFNAHTLVATRSVSDPAAAYTLPEGGGDLTDAIETTALTLYYQEFSLPGGVAPGQVLALAHPVLFNGAALVVLNQGLRLRNGVHYTIAGEELSLDFRDTVDPSGPSIIQVWAPAGLVGGTMNMPGYHLETVTTEYNSGFQFTLPFTPIDTDHLIITFNQSFTLRPGTEYTLAGNVVTILFDGTPMPGDPDTFAVNGWAAVPEAQAVAVAGFAHFSFSTSRIVDQDYFELPAVPLAGTLYLRMDSGLLLFAPDSYQVSGRVVTWTEDILPPNGSGLIDIDVWFAH